MQEKYYVGFDLGTNSVGLAVTDTKHNLLKLKGEKGWSVRLFDEADTAKKRRVYRTTRRRAERRKTRVNLLKNFFANEIEKTDETFFARLENSGFLPEDKNIQETTKYSLFSDADFTDKDYYKKFKTIYHLRNYLMNTHEKVDIRLVYLAVHHIIKYRGHFLYEGNFNAKERNFAKTLDKINMFLLERFPEFENQTLIASDEILLKLEDVIKNNKLSLAVKREELMKLFNVKGKQIEHIFRALMGQDASLGEIFLDKETFSKDAEVSKFTFSSAAYEIDVEGKLISFLGSDFDLIAALKEGYDYIVLKNLLGSCNTLSDAMIAKYEEHEKDLRLLKGFLLANYPKKVYDEVFKFAEEFQPKIIKPKKPKNLEANTEDSIDVNPDENHIESENKNKNENEKKSKKKLVNYAYYIGMVKNKKVKYALPKCSQKDFGAFVKKILESRQDLKDDPTYITILEKIESDSFMPKQLSKANSAIPFQLNRDELKEILNRAAAHYPFLNEIGDGLSVADKIIQLLEFRIPFYVGPINYEGDSGKSKFAWSVAENKLPLTPWNFDKIVDIEKSYNAFIDNLINHCTHLPKYKVLPKESLLYSEYNVLNELNAISIDGVRINLELREEIYEKLFKTKTNITKKMLTNWLIIEKKYNKDISVSGFMGDNKFSNYLTSYIKLKNILGDWVDNNTPQAEELIKAITIYSSSRKFLQEHLNKNYQFFGSEKLAKLAELKFKDWARFSKEFLVDTEAAIIETGERISIIEALRHNIKNLNEILADSRYTFRDVLLDTSENSASELTYEHIDELYVSPAVKRPIWQALKSLKEVVDIKGYAPDKIFIEFARTNKADKKRTTTRRDRILEFYGSNKSAEIMSLKNDLERYSDAELRDDKLYLYFLQEGKCLYSGEAINIEEISVGFDIDHIIPRALIKDDSLNNKVLVKRSLNNEKGDTYPIDLKIPEKVRELWNVLKSKKQISVEKYDRLTRTAPLTDTELEQFVNRQLVALNQTNLVVAKLLKTFFPDTKVVYSKAENVTDFRKEFELTKIRELNDLHHAKDAYLNIVVGDVLDAHFGSDIKKYIIEKRYRNQKSDNYNGFNVMKVFGKNVVRENSIVWSVNENNKSIDKVREVFYKNDIIVSRFTSSRKGEFSDQLASKGKVKGEENGALIPLKTTDSRYLNTSVYGGYTGVSRAYFCAIKFTEKDGEKIALFNVPLIVDAKLRGGKYSLEEYFKHDLGLDKFEIVCPKININSLLRIDGVEYNITGTTGNAIYLNSAIQFKASENIIKVIKPMSEYYNIISRLAKKPGQGASEIKLSAKQKGIDGKKLNDTNALEVFDYITDKFNKKPFSNMITMKGLIDKVVENRENYIKLSLENKSLLIINLLIAIGCNAVSGDLSLIGLNKKSSRITMTKNITNRNVELIHYSVSGFNKKIVVINKVK